MSSSPAILARKIRDLRYAKGWGAFDLANRASISRTALYQIESGRTELPRAGTLKRIALALGTSPEDLLRESEAPAAAPPPAPLPGGGLTPMVPDVEWKFRAVMASPLGSSLLRIVEESYHLLATASQIAGDPALGVVTRDGNGRTISPASPEAAAPAHRANGHGNGHSHGRRANRGTGS